MANELPEVVPDVRSMPTSGWFLQTSGSARRRVSRNKGTELEGIYDVTGVPGHTHNASAVISIDAAYTEYRTTNITLPPRIWSHEELRLHVGQITDSIEPDDAAERYDRCIERCVGRVVLTPENCTGFIRDPTRSISEIRTLVAPKAKLDTLTYMDERRGWVVPDPARFPRYQIGGLGPWYNNTEDRPLLVSSFPSIDLDVRCLTPVMNATLYLNTSPGSLYIESTTAAARLRINRTAGAAVGSGQIGTYSDGSPWDGTLKFVWNDDRRLYQTLHPVTVELSSCRPFTIGGAVENPTYDGAAAVNHSPRITVQFPILETTPSLDGYCWFGNMQNEEALRYATSTRGLVLSKKINVEVLGVETHAGPWSWVGMPAYRIPVGSKYAHPAPDVLQESVARFNHWSHFNAFRHLDAEPGKSLLEYHLEREQAELAHTDAYDADVAPGAGADEALALANAVARRSPNTFHLEARSLHANGNMFFSRTGGILSQLTETHYTPEPDFSGAPDTQYATAHPGGVAPITSGIVNTVYSKDGETDIDAIQALLDGHAAALNAAEALVAAADVAFAIIDARITLHTAGVAAATTAYNTAYTDYGIAIEAGDPGQAVIEQLAIDAALADLATSQGELANANGDHIDDTVLYQIAVRDVFEVELAEAQNQIRKIAATQPFDVDQEGNYGVLSVFVPPPNYNLKGSTSFDLTAGALGVQPLPDVHTSDRFCTFSGTPLYHQSRILVPDVDGQAQPNRTNFNGAALRVGKGAAGAVLHIPKVIANCSKLTGRVLTVDYDFADSLVEDSTIVADVAAYAGPLVGTKMVLQGHSLWLPLGDNSSFEAGTAATGSVAETLMQFGAGFSTGNRFAVPATSWFSTNLGGGTQYSGLIIQDYVFALSKRSGFAGIYLETQAVLADGKKKLFFCRYWKGGASVLPQCRIIYEHAAGAPAGGQPPKVQTASRIQTEPLEVYHVSAFGGGAAIYERATHATVNALAASDLYMYLIGPDWYTSRVLDDPYAEIRADSISYGSVFQSVKRISQHLCGPVINPNVRIGAQAPLNHDSRHLPPELRDFRLELQNNDWGRLQASSITLNELVLYEFNGGNQVAGTEHNVLYLPEFREYKKPVTDNTFEVECHSNLGCPSYYCIFCRSDVSDILQQPKIKSLSIFCKTTQKKSNSIHDASVGQLFHMTQRNVHPFAEYDRAAYNRRQTVLLSAEDVGLLGLKLSEYQRAKRVTYVVSGTTDRPGQLVVILVYNNRGLHIDGRRLQLVTLHE